MVPLNVQKKSSSASTVPVAVHTIVSTPEPMSKVAPPLVVEPPLVPPPTSQTLLAPTLGANLTPQRDRRSARESRISLPDEAARYIAAMGDSPLTSPFFGSGQPGNTAGSTEQAPQDAEFGKASEPVSPDAEATVRGNMKKGEEEEQDRTPLAIEVSYPSPPERPPPAPPIQASGPGPAPGHAHGYGYGPNGLGRNGSLDYDAATPMPTQLTYPTQQQPYPPYGAPAPQPPTRPQLQTQSSGSTGKSSMQQQQQQPSASVVSLTSSQLSSPADSIQAVPYPISEYSRTDSRDTYQSPQTVQAPSFRDAGYYDLGAQGPTQPRTTPYPSPAQSHAPPPPRLHPSQLGSTRIRIAGSNIRSNERGKDVLSFLISIYPPSTSHAQNQGAEEWKVEKMYSDVLTLDGTVRSALGRSHAKKLPPLPDAKLFKDNAPAKVDQRRVSNQYISFPNLNILLSRQF